MIHSKDGKVKERTSRANVEVVGEEATLNEAKSVPGEVTAHHKTCRKQRVADISSGTILNYTSSRAPPKKAAWLI